MTLVSTGGATDPNTAERAIDTGELLEHDQLPPFLGAAVAAIDGARGNPEYLDRLFQTFPIPMAVLDDGWRFRRANRAAQLLLRRRVGDIVGLEAEDVFPSTRDVLAANRALMRANGSVRRRREITFRDGSTLDLVYVGLSHVWPDEHLFLCAPSGWPDDEISRSFEEDGHVRPAPLTDRELDVLRLIAEGATARQVAERLVISESTVKTHLGHIYEKLDVPDRAAAVARAIRLGLIL
jgi:DNA-binding CsgD family transcriptional regulator